MSGKIMQRGLVLGALMAFVITGNVWAATVENNATASHAIAIGENTVSNGICSIAVGFEAKTNDALGATAIGERAQANSNAAAYGKQSNASGSSSVAVGFNSNAVGTNSLAIGSNATSNGGVAIGASSVVNASNAISLGTLANASGGASISLGYDAESNKHGDIAIGFLAVADSTADGYSATAVGREAVATGKCSVAYGKNAKALDNRATAIGHNAVASRVGDLALGAESATDIVTSVNGATIGGLEYDFAGGDANNQNVVVAASFGGETTSSAFEASSSNPKMLYRQLQKVAAGQVSATSTDAVNGSQLYAAYEAIDSVVDTATQHSDRITELESSEVIQNAAILDNSKAINGLNQRLDRTNTRLDKVGAGAAALAALHPLEYDPDDKLTFSAGMGNYSGENAAALGAFYRPNEKFMVSLGGTMGNGENMVNVGVSIGLDKPNGFAQMSKRELIQEVTAVKAENETMKAEMAEMKALLQELLAKK